MCKQNNGGSLLITALWAVSLFSVMSLNLAFHASEQVLMMKREFENLNARADFFSGLNQTAALIHQDPDPHEDSPADPWFGDLSLEGALGERITVRSEDEESKVNLNEALEAFLNTFFTLFEDEVSPLQGSRKDSIKAIVKLRSKKRIESLEELLPAEGFEKKDFAVLRPYLTVYPERPFLNPNTASPLVRRAFVESLPGDHSSKQMLARRLEEAHPFFLSSDLDPETFREKLALPAAPLMMQVIQECVTGLAVDSETFRTVMKSKSGHEAEAVFRLRSGRTRPEVLGWRES